MNITNSMPVIVRYAIVSLMAARFTRGWLSPEHNAILGETSTSSFRQSSVC